VIYLVEKIVNKQVEQYDTWLERTTHYKVVS